MTSSSLSRHKRNKKCQSNQKIVLTEAENQPAINPRQTGCAKYLSVEALHDEDIVDVNEVQIEAKISVLKHRDGTVTIVQSGIKLDENCTLYLTTKKPESEFN